MMHPQTFKDCRLLKGPNPVFTHFGILTVFEHDSPSTCTCHFWSSWLGSTHSSLEEYNSLEVHPKLDHKGWQDAQRVVYSPYDTHDITLGWNQLISCSRCSVHLPPYSHLTFVPLAVAFECYLEYFWHKSANQHLCQRARSILSDPSSPASPHCSSWTSGGWILPLWGFFSSQDLVDRQLLVCQCQWLHHLHIWNLPIVPQVLGWRVYSS